MRRNRPFVLSSAAMCIALACGSIVSAPALGGPGPLATDAAIVIDDPVDLDFPGGTLGEYLDAVSRTCRANIVAGPEVRALRMPPLQLRGVTPYSTIRLVESLFPDPSVARVSIDQISPDSEESPAEGSTSIFVVRVDQAQRRAGGTVVNDVFSIGDVLRPANEEPTEAQVKQIFEMIESAMSLSPGSGEPELAYHDQTQMLVFKGSPEQREMVQAVLARYVQTWRPASSRAEALRREMSEYELRAETLAIEARTADERLHAAAQAYERASQLAEQGAVSEGQVQEARTRVIETESRARILELEARHARSRMEEARASLAAVTQGAAPSVVVYDIRGLGDRGQRFVAALNQLAAVVGDDGTQVLATEAERTLTLQAGPTLHEAVRTMLEKMRANASRGGR
ncbi:MAG: hypothetical protein H6809_05805 [Phycisphaeraceae bacterium]|nr:hypothetical protein [Phycisphaeraceae bacterium]